MKRNTVKIARAGIIGALYFVMTVLFLPISYGAFQFRFSEALCVLPLIFPECAIGLTIGCFFANIFGNGILDLVLGTLATLLASLFTAFAGRIKNNPLKLILGETAPILLNALLVPFTFMVATDTIGVYFFNVLTVGLGELVVISTLGTILYFGAKKALFNK